MATMRENIARAIADEVGRRKNVSVEQLADAALNALSEPTEAMIDAADNYCVGCCNMLPGHVAEVFSVLIQAAKDGA